MIAAFYLDNHDEVLTACARKCVESVRKHMPDARIVQLGDGADVGVEKVYGDYRGKPFAYRRNDAQSMIDGEAIFLDVDVIVQSDLSHVFDREFDVAIVTDMRPGSEGIRFDSCIAFSRNPEVWKDLRDYLGHFDFQRKDGDWQPVMEAYTKFFEQRKYKTLVLPGRDYGYVPDSQDEKSTAKVVHFRGLRKVWM